MGTREYDPAVMVHAADCADAPPGLMVFPAVAVAQAHPHGRPHRCVDSAYMARNGDAVVERIDYEPHDYVASTIHLPDATRPLCRTCRGTHSHGAELPTASPGAPLAASSAAPPAASSAAPRAEPRPTLLIVRR